MSKVLNLCITYVYHMTVDDEGTCEWLMEETGLSGSELMEEFKRLNQKFGLDLKKKVGNRWSEETL